MGLNLVSAMPHLMRVRVRSAMTGLLAAIVLCVFCASSACAIDCEMNGLQPDGHVGHHHSVVVDQSVPDHCGSGAASQSKPEISPGNPDVHMEQQCDGKFCISDQVATLINGGYQQDQESALIARTFVTPGYETVINSQIHGVADWIRNRAPRHLDVLRL